MGEDATKGLTDLRASLISHTRNLSLTVPAVVAGSSKDAEDGGTTPTATRGGDSMAEGSQESETVLSRLRAEAAKRLKDIQKAEDAADEALLRFGSNVRNYLRDAVSVSAPDANDQSGTVLFESKDAQGKRVIHASRFDAQLHVIHTTTESFNKDPSGSEYDLWTKEFDVDKKTPDINTDLQKYPDLRATMEKLVPDQIPYADFWKRYYFLRHGIETADARRRDLLKGELPLGFTDMHMLTDSQPPPPRMMLNGMMMIPTKRLTKRLTKSPTRRSPTKTIPMKKSPTTSPTVNLPPPPLPLPLPLPFLSPPRPSLLLSRPLPRHRRLPSTPQPRTS